MVSVNEIDVQKVKEIIDNGSGTIVDIRDSASFQAGHIPDAINLSDASVQQFVSNTDKKKPLVVYCYHGISSQGAAVYFSENGFKDVSSMIGGFEAWRAVFFDSADKKWVTLLATKKPRFRPA